MATATKIEWTDATFNAWIGCSRVHEGCRFCYAEADQADRRGRVVWGQHGTRSATSYSYWREPYKWNRDAAAAGERHRVFCCSLADVFEDWPGQLQDVQTRPLWFDPLQDRDCDGRPIWNPVRGDDSQPLTLETMRRELFALIDATPNLDWLLLTKRPENVRKMWPAEDDGYDGKLAEAIFGRKGKLIRRRENCWLLTSVSDQPTAKAMIPALLECRDLVPVLGVSYEPALGPVDLECIRDPKRFPGAAYFDVLRGRMIHEDDFNQWTREPKLDWVIVGCESGPHRRPMQLTWAESVVQQCLSAGVAIFVKQIEVNGKVSGELSDFPESLRVRQFPQEVCSERKAAP